MTVEPWTGDTNTPIFIYCRGNEINQRENEFKPNPYSVDKGGLEGF